MTRFVQYLSHSIRQTIFCFQPIYQINKLLMIFVFFRSPVDDLGNQPSAEISEDALPLRLAGVGLYKSGTLGIMQSKPAASPGSSRHLPNLGGSPLVQEEMAPVHTKGPRGYRTPTVVERPQPASSKKAKLLPGRTRFVVRIVTGAEHHLTFA
jgi:hypothetical protein